MSAIKHFRSFSVTKEAFTPTSAEEHFEQAQDLLSYLTELQQDFLSEGCEVSYTFGLSKEAEGGTLLLGPGGRASFWIVARKPGAKTQEEVRLTLTKRLTEKVAALLGDQNFRADYADNAGQAAVRAALPVIGNRRFGKHTETGALFMF